MSDNQIVESSNWYQKLVEDIRKLEFTGIVITKWHIGKRILEDELKFEKPEYGSKRIENLAKDVGFSRSTLTRCIQVIKKWPTKDEFVHACTNLPWREIIKLLPENREEQQIPLFPENKYGIIYADPPWQYWEGGYKNQSQHYPTLKASEIANLRDMAGVYVGEIAADDCILFLWQTGPMLMETVDIMENWGFKYSTIGFVWVKSKKDNTGFFFGNGNWTRANIEVCLIGTRGSIPRQDASISQIIYEPPREHSKKPECVRDKIIQLVGDLPRIELFARGKTLGWDVWGNEIHE